MGFLMPTVKMVAPQALPPPAPPTAEDAAAKAEQAAADLRKRRGAASTVLTGAQGDTSQPLTATKALLGS